MNKEIKKAWNGLNGYKTYISIGLMIVWSGLLAQGYIDQRTYEIGLTILGALGLASLRHAVSKLE